jgi:hypothetical protein
MYNNLPALTDSILWDNGLLAKDYSVLDAEALMEHLAVISTRSAYSERVA